MENLNPDNEPDPEGDTAEEVAASRRGQALAGAVLRAARRLSASGLGGEDVCRAIPVLMALRRLHDAFLENAGLLVKAGIPDAQALQPAHHAWFLPSEALWRNLLLPASGETVAHRLDGALAAVEASNPALEGCLAWWGFERHHVGDTALRGALEELGELDLRTQFLPSADIIGPSYEALKREYARGLGSQHGEFYTPANVTKMMVMMTAPEPGKSVLDPCCGTGGMLAETALYLCDTHGKPEQVLPPPALLVGQDISAPACAAAMCNLVALGYLNSVIVCRNALSEPVTIEEVHGIIGLRNAKTMALRHTLMQREPPVMPSLSAARSPVFVPRPKRGRIRAGAPRQAGLEAFDHGTAAASS